MKIISHNKIQFLILSFTFLLSSCFPVRYISIDVLKPAEISIPSEIKSLSVISAKNELNTAKGSLNNINNIRKDYDFNYHLISWDYLYGMEEILLESPRFDRVVVSWINLFDYYKWDGYEWNDLVKITKTDTTDAIIILDDYFINDSIEYLEYMGACYVNFKLENTLKWTILYPKNLQVVTSDTFSTIMNWERDGFNCEEAFYAFPEGWDMLKESAFNSGQSLATEIAPFWKSNESRNYFISGNSSIKSGSIYANRDEWEKASEFWYEAFTSKNKKIKARAAYNISLAYEMQDDIEKSAEFINLSDSLFSTTFSRIYKKKINERLKDRELLDKQLNTPE